MERKKKYPITQDFLENYSFDYPPLIPLYRNYDVQKDYDTFKSSDKFLTFIDNIKKMLLNKKSLLRLNDFPYYTTENIKHYVLWINNTKDSRNTVIDKEYIKNEIGKYFDIDLNNESNGSNGNNKINKREKIITYWINISSNCSISDVLHVHVFTKLI